MVSQQLGITIFFTFRDYYLFLKLQENTYFFKLNWIYVGIVTLNDKDCILNDSHFSYEGKNSISYQSVTLVK